MAWFLIDVNLPYYFSLWHGNDYLHLKELTTLCPIPKFVASPKSEA
jgi:hypothetical protein